MFGKVGAKGPDDGDAVSSAHFYSPAGLSLDPQGNLFISDSSNNTIRKLDTNHQVTTLAGKAESSGSEVGACLQSRFCSPFALTVVRDGSVYVADMDNQVIKRIRDNMVIVYSGTVRSSGNSDGKVDEAKWNRPASIVSDSHGNLFVGEASNHTIRMVSTKDGTVTTVAGGKQGFLDGRGADAMFDRPYGIAVDHDGNLVVSDFGNRAMRRVNLATGDVTTINLGQENQLHGPCGVVGLAGLGFERRR